MLSKVAVTVLGVLLIILVNWYFLFSRKKSVFAETKPEGLQEVKVIVKGGYSPDVIVVRKGIPVRLNFYRDEGEYVFTCGMGMMRGKLVVR
jgi:plastocyanin domain-containing protein